MNSRIRGTSTLSLVFGPNTCCNHNLVQCMRQTIKNFLVWKTTEPARFGITHLSFLFHSFDISIKKTIFLYGIVYFEYVNNLATYLCAVHLYVLFSHKKLHFFWYRWRSYHEYLVQGQFLIVAIATIGIMEKYTGQTFIIDTYEKNDNNSMRLDPLCNFCLHFQISGAGVNIITVARDRLFITIYVIYHTRLLKNKRKKN